MGLTFGYETVSLGLVVGGSGGVRRVMRAYFRSLGWWDAAGVGGL